MQKKLPTINSAHGSETRNIINELIKLFNGMGYTYDEALQKAHDTLNEAKKTNNMNKDVQRQLDNIILENGDSEAEVVQARGRADLLYKRLNSIDDVAGINVKDYGAVGDGVTIDNDSINEAIQNIGSGGILKFPPGTYLIDADGTGYNGQTNAGIMVKKPMTIMLDDGAILKAKPTDNTGYAVLSVIDTEKVSIIGGRIEGERHEHTGTSGEWGHGLKIDNSNNIVVRDLIIEHCWGDGVVLRTPQEPNVYDENILFDNVILNGNRRNGISLGPSKNVVLRNCTFSNTSGKMPQAGIDIEPDGVTSPAENITIDGCNFFGNKSQDIVFGGGVGCKDIKVINCNIDSEATAINVLQGADTVSISNCFIKTQQNGMAIGNANNVSMTDTIIKSLTTDVTNIAITLRSDTGIKIGGCLFEDFGITFDLSNTLNHLSLSNNTFKNMRIDFIRTSSNELNFAKIANNKMLNVNSSSVPNTNDSVFNGNDYINSNIRGNLLRCIITNNSFRDFEKTAISATTLNSTVISHNLFESDHSGVFAVIDIGRADEHEQNVVFSNIAKNVTPTYIMAETDLRENNINI